MASWQDTEPTEAEVTDRVVEALVIVAIALMCIAALAWGPTLMKAIGL